jgi:hypothetical protein
LWAELQGATDNGLWGHPVGGKGGSGVWWRWIQSRKPLEMKRAATRGRGVGGGFASASAEIGRGFGGRSRWRQMVGGAGARKRSSWTVFHGPRVSTFSVDGNNSITEPSPSVMHSCVSFPGLYVSLLYACKIDATDRAGRIASAVAFVRIRVPDYRRMWNRIYPSHAIRIRGVVEPYYCAPVHLPRRDDNNRSSEWCLARVQRP